MLSPTIANGADADPSAMPNILRWSSCEPAMRWQDVLTSTAKMTLVYALMIAALGLLALLLVTPFVLWNGEDWLEIAAGWFDPEMLLGGFGMAVAMGSIPALFIWLYTHVETFEMDMQAQSLQVLESRAWLKPVRRVWAFTEIEEVVPTLGSSGGTLMIGVRNTRGRIRRLEVGDSFSAAELEQHARWLRAYLGERVRPLLELSD